ncbi:MAG TPA: TonB-dependent receptor [Pyrinomonadaceae bacterium]|nr:TonB-dependent receptor [Pyrinomonadaceae bacterium]
MRLHKLSAAALLALTLVLCAAPALAQSDRGSITGTVTDPGGAVVANAKITATSLETGEAREAATSDEGGYTLPELRAGRWRVSAEAPGFKTATVEEYKVAVQTTHSVDFQLEVGGVGEVVNVTAEAGAVIQSDTPVRQTNVNERQVKELPLQVQSEFAGRTPLSFIFLDSNVSTGASGSPTSTTNFRVSGGQALGTEILIDGAATRRTQNGTFFSEVAPGPNAFQEFTLSTSTYSAEFGNSSGGIVNFTLKSGTNEFHGELYNLLRNEVFNANTFRNNAAGRDANGEENLPRNRDNQNDFGFNIGGPIYLPNFGEGGPALKSMKDRGFFFFNYEGYRFTQGENAIITVPTERMRRGDFSELLTDPYVLQFFGRPIQIYNPRQDPSTREAIAGNRLDLRPDLIDPAGLAALQFFPLPNRTGPGGSTVFRNYLASSARPTDMDQFTAKLDFVLTQAQRLTGSYSRRTNDRLASFANRFPRFPLPFINQDVWAQAFRSHFFRLQHDWTASPTLLNHFNLGLTRYDVANRNTTEGFDPTTLGLPANATQRIAFPRIGFPGYGDSFGSDNPRSYQEIGSSFFTDRIRDTNWQFSDFVTWVRGNHTLKFGGDVRPSQFNFFQRIDPGASFNFRHDQTAANRDPDGGWPIASLITGATEFSFNSTDSIDPAFRQLTHGYFIQDDWKVTQNLTLNLGLRYDIPGMRSEARNRFRGFDPTAPNPEAGGRPGALAGAGGQGGIQARSETLVETDYSNWGPRAGFAYALNNRTVVRGGAGLYYAPVIYGFEGGNVLNTGLIGFNSNSGPRQPFCRPVDDCRQAAFFLSSYPATPPVAPNSQFLGSDVQFFDPDFKTGRTLQWSLDVQRELPWNFVTSAGYIGHRATRLRSNFGRLNALPLNALRLGFPVLVMPLSAALADPDVVAYAQSVGVTLPSSNDAVFPGFGGTVAQALRPFPQYNRINNILESRGRSDYHAMQLKLERRFAQGIQAGASYTFSKLLTDASEDLFGGGGGLGPQAGVLQNPFDIASARTISPNNPAHVLVINYLIELPFGRGKRWLNRGGIIDRLVGGWQLSGIHRYQSGTPLSFFTTEPGNTNFLQDVGYLGALRLNRTGAPVEGSGQFIDNRLGVQIINPAAFAPPPNFQAPPTTDVTAAAYRNYYANPLVFFGNTAPALADVLSDPFYNEDLSLLKKTRITETLTLELGAEAFNLFNRHGFFRPTTDLRDVGNFGFQSVDDRARVIQLRARVIF